MFSVFVYFFFYMDLVIWNATLSCADEDLLAASTVDQSVLKGGL